ncbi:MAG: hypothetical protein PHD68_10910, partial [Rugosibacter sp.]|nr:hypothetical protein [Rugosibacter sp.]
MSTSSAALTRPLTELEHKDEFIARHLGPDDTEVQQMLGVIDADSLAILIDQTVPQNIRRRQPLDL